MDSTYLYEGVCPHCKKSVEIQIKRNTNINMDIKLVKEKDSLSPSTVLTAKLREKKLEGKFKSFRKALFKVAKKKMSLNEVKKIAQKVGVRDKKDMGLMLDVLMYGGELFQLKEGIFKVG